MQGRRITINFACIYAQWEMEYMGTIPEPGYHTTPLILDSENDMLSRYITKPKLHVTTSTADNESMGTSRITRTAPPKVPQGTYSVASPANQRSSKRIAEVAYENFQLRAHGKEWPHVAQQPASEHDVTAQPPVDREAQPTVPWECVQRTEKQGSRKPLAFSPLIFEPPPGSYSYLITYFFPHILGTRPAKQSSDVLLAAPASIARWWYFGTLTRILASDERRQNAHKYTARYTK